MSLADFSASVSISAPAIFIGPQSNLLVPSISLPSIGHDVFFEGQGIPFQCAFDSQGAFTGVTASGIAYNNTVFSNIVNGILATTYDGFSGPIYYGKSHRDISLKTVSMIYLLSDKYLLGNVNRNTLGGWMLHLFTNFIDYQLSTNANTTYSAMTAKPSTDWISDQSAALTTMFTTELTAALSSQQFNQKILNAMLLATQFPFDGTSSSVQYFKPTSVFPAVDVQMNINVSYEYTLNGASSRTLSIVCPMKFSIVPGTFQDLRPETITLGSMLFSRLYGVSIQALYDVVPANTVSASLRIPFPSLSSWPRYLLLDQLPYIECSYLAVTLIYQTIYEYTNSKIFEASNSNTHALNRVPMLAFEGSISNVTLYSMEITIWNPSFNTSNDLMIAARQQTLIYTM